MSTTSSEYERISKTSIAGMLNTIQKQKETILELKKGVPGDTDALVSSLQAELEAVKAALAARPLTTSNKKRMGISKGGGIYIWLPGRKFPLTLYKSQIEKIFGMETDIRGFVRDHQDELRSADETE